MQEKPNAANDNRRHVGVDKTDIYASPIWDMMYRCFPDAMRQFENTPIQSLIRLKMSGLLASPYIDDIDFDDMAKRLRESGMPEAAHLMPRLYLMVDAARAYTKYLAALPVRGAGQKIDRTAGTMESPKTVFRAALIDFAAEVGAPVEEHGLNLAIGDFETAIRSLTPHQLR